VEQILGLKIKGQGHWERKCKNRFSRVFVKNGWNYVNQDQNDQRPILDISSNTFHQRKCFIFVIRECRMSQRPSGRAPTCLLWT